MTQIVHLVCLANSRRPPGRRVAGERIKNGCTKAWIRPVTPNWNCPISVGAGRPGEFEPHETLLGEGSPFDTCAINKYVYRLRASSGLGQNLFYSWLSSDLIMEVMLVNGTGVAIPGLNKTQLNSLTTFMRTHEVAWALNTLVQPLTTRILASWDECRTLAAMRDTLLPELISGALRVMDAERKVEGGGA